MMMMEMGQRLLGWLQGLWDWISCQHLVLPNPILHNFLTPVLWESLIAIGEVNITVNAKQNILDTNLLLYWTCLVEMLEKRGFRNCITYPIKSPGFITSNNGAHVMEAAAKIRDPGPQPAATETMPSVGSSSVPLKVQDLKEKVEAAQRPPRLNGAYLRSVESNAVKILKVQSLNRSSNGSEDRHRFRPSSDESNSVGLWNKERSVSLAVQAKVNVQKGESFGGGSRNLMGLKKECKDLKSNQLLIRSRLNTHKIVQKKLSAQTASSAVLRQNNQKQNCPVNGENLLYKPSSNMRSRKTHSHNRTLTKVAANCKVAPTKVGMEMTETGKEVPSLGAKNLPRKKRSIDGQFERRRVVENVFVRKDERPIQPNMADIRRKGMEVVSFTFTSPMIRPTPGSQSSSPVVDKAKSFVLDPCDEKSTAGSKNSKLSNLGLDVIGGDALSILLERKLRELTYGVESSCNNKAVKSGNASTSASILQDLSLL